jgi:glycosyltransferase involved in cell wall biosynthesis/GT2 family glycosyltransferase
MKVLRLAHHAVVSAWRERERELRRLGIDVALISSKRWNEGGVDVRLQTDGDSFVQGAATIGRHPSVFLFDPMPIWRALGQRPELIDLHEEPNALVTAEVLFLRWLRRSRAPYVLYSAQNLEKRYPVPFRWIERRALRGAAAAYVCNHEAGEILARKGLTAPALYIPLGVDIQLFSPATRGVPGSKKVLGYVGRLERHKGVDTLLRALVGREEWRLQVSGDGPQRAELEKLAEVLGIAARVRFLGHAAGHVLADRYRELDVIAVPSLPWPGWSEQFCRVAVEAMASGVPVVASATGAIPDVVAGAGLLVEPGDPAALARGIDAALETERWAQLRTAGLARSASFTWARVAELQREMYSGILAEGDDSHPTEPEVLIVAYGSPDQLDECLTTLGAGLSVTIVDNSSLGRVRELAEAHGARYIDADRNRGFAGGVNLGLAAIAARAGAGTDVLLLNPDARIDQSSVRLMCRQLRRSRRVAAIGAVQTEPGSGKAVRVWWPFPTPWGAWIEAVGFGALRRRKDFAIGSILLLRGEAIDQVGMLDERFFLYAEETDWQRRARKLGWSIEVAAVGATHEGAGTGGDPQKREAHFYGSAERYIRKHYGASGWQVYRAANIAGAALRGVVLPGARGAVARRRRDIFLRGPIATERAWR